MTGDSRKIVENVGMKWSICRFTREFGAKLAS